MNVKESVANYIEANGFNELYKRCPDFPGILVNGDETSRQNLLAVIEQDGKVWQKLNEKKEFTFISGIHTLPEQVYNEKSILKVLARRKSIQIEIDIKEETTNIEDHEAYAKVEAQAITYFLPKLPPTELLKALKYLVQINNDDFSPITAQAVDLLKENIDDVDTQALLKFFIKEKGIEDSDEYQSHEIKSPTYFYFDRKGNPEKLQAFTLALKQLEKRIKNDEISKFKFISLCNNAYMFQNYNSTQKFTQLGKVLYEINTNVNKTTKNIYLSSFFDSKTEFLYERDENYQNFLQFMRSILAFIERNQIRDKKIAISEKEKIYIQSIDKDGNETNHKEYYLTQKDPNYAKTQENPTSQPKWWNKECENFFLWYFQRSNFFPRQKMYTIGHLCENKKEFLGIMNSYFQEKFTPEVQTFIPLWNANEITLKAFISQFEIKDIYEIGKINQKMRKNGTYGLETLLHLDPERFTFFNNAKKEDLKKLQNELRVFVSAGLVRRPYSFAELPPEFIQTLKRLAKYNLFHLTEDFQAIRKELNKYSDDINYNIITNQAKNALAKAIKMKKDVEKRFAERKTKKQANSN